MRGLKSSLWQLLEEEENRMGLEQTVEEKAGVSHSTVDRVRRVCWEMPCKVYIPCCLFT